MARGRAAGGRRRVAPPVAARSDRTAGARQGYTRTARPRDDERARSRASDRARVSGRHRHRRRAALARRSPQPTWRRAPAPRSSARPVSIARRPPTPRSASTPHTPPIASRGATTRQRPAKPSSSCPVPASFSADRPRRAFRAARAHPRRRARAPGSAKGLPRRAAAAAGRALPSDSWPSTSRAAHPHMPGAHARQHRAATARCRSRVSIQSATRSGRAGSPMTTFVSRCRPKPRVGDACSGRARRGAASSRSTKRGRDRLARQPRCRDQDRQQQEHAERHPPAIEPRRSGGSRPRTHSSPTGVARRERQWGAARPLPAAPERARRSRSLAHADHRATLAVRWPTPPADHAGHRARLRERLLSAAADGAARPRTGRISARARASRAATPSRSPRRCCASSAASAGC